MIRNAQGSPQALTDALDKRLLFMPHPVASKADVMLVNHVRNYADEAQRMLSLKEQLQKAAGKQVVVSMDSVQNWLASMPEPVHAFRKKGGTRC
jgi:hypothetical protein